jgi:hypothetical protein
MLTEGYKMGGLEAEPPLPDESLLLEYQVSKDLGERNALYRDRTHFRQYWEGNKWLRLDFERGEPCVRARHFVGLMPFRCEDKNHLIMVGPKGCSFDTPANPVGLLRFLDMAAIADGGEPIDELKGFSAKLGRDAFVAILAGHYGRLLNDLCRIDYRRYFQPIEQNLSGRIQGRIHISGHVRNTIRGRQHQIPCRWEEFTPDNWDNRILLAALRRIQVGAALIAPEAGRYVNNLFRGLDAWFSSVEELPIGPADFVKARLWRTSRHYRNALNWARLIIQGFGRPVTGGEASPLVIDANDVFERFAKAVTQVAVNSIDPRWQSFPTSLVFFRGCQADRNPDLAVRNEHGVVAIGDAKYKDILDQSISSNELGNLLHVIIPKISAADWYQLYVYIRLAKASRGFFVVPFWSKDGDAAQLVTDREFEVSTLDHAEGRSVRLAVIGLNLIHPLNQVRNQAARLVAAWLQGDAK